MQVSTANAAPSALMEAVIRSQLLLVESIHYMKAHTPPDASMVPATSSSGALAALSLCMLMASLDTSIANAGLPTLALAFDAPFAHVQWIVLAYLLAITTLIVSVGRLADLLGRRRLLILGIVVFTLASLLCGTAPALGVLIAARAIQGVGAAMMMALAMALVGESVAQARTGSAMGWLGSMSALGTTLGPALGGLLIAGIGWQAIFLVNLPLGVVCAVLAYRYLPVDPPRAPGSRSRFDWAGSLLLALVLSAYGLAMTLGEGRAGPSNAVLLLFAVAGVGVFIRYQARTASPLIRLELLRHPLLSAGLGMNLLVSTVVMSTLVVGPFYLTRGLGLNPWMAGFVLSTGPCVAALTGVPAGRIVDRLGASRITVMGLLAMVCGASGLALLPMKTGIVGYIGPLMVLTAGYALFQAANNTRVMTVMGAHQRGVTAGLLSLSRNLGLITGASFMGAVFAFASALPGRGSEPIAAVTQGAQATFAVAAVLVLLALVLAYAGQVRWQRAEVLNVPPSEG